MGSSSGSAVGVAANAIAFSLGTETDGSVIRPAHKNGVVGIKPTVGLASQDGSANIKTRSAPSVELSVTQYCLHNATFGIPWNSFWAIANEETKAQLGSLINLIQENGGTIINGTEITNHVTVVNKAGWDWNWQGKIGHPEKSEYTVVLVDFDNNIKKYLSELQNTKMRSLEDIIKFNYENDGTEGG
ncbi:hypothetical protein CaCOL14_012410 [Colletotrichum acutatum]